jgi:hypothetical protein
VLFEEQIAEFAEQFPASGGYRLTGVHRFKRHGLFLLCLDAAAGEPKSGGAFTGSKP